MRSFAHKYDQKIYALPNPTKEIKQVKKSTLKCDPWLSTREAAELMLNYPEFPRTRQRLRTEQIAIAEACKQYQKDASHRNGLASEKVGRDYRFRLSELNRWNARRSSNGGVYQVEARKDRR